MLHLDVRLLFDRTGPAARAPHDTEQGGKRRAITKTSVVKDYGRAAGHGQSVISVHYVRISRRRECGRNAETRRKEKLIDPCSHCNCRCIRFHPFTHPSLPHPFNAELPLTGCIEVPSTVLRRRIITLWSHGRGAQLGKYFWTKHLGLRRRYVDSRPPDRCRWATGGIQFQRSILNKWG